ncbi:PASTA domain-containing protein [Paenibacillus psychroresistens]|uniref:PASTA domain-containing protein n=1 Tax=Paenibacillus psychroresistens TaxID=1778678 RepID=A0A6B8RSP6_9BACL|nr:Stk1 family PASTA domain-containing Ser/Thr kinase [Paenibacillus psychroresistens]QGQ98248.1 PASTA domain-containing protein [Paenibacillus psychroresistens]
MNRSMEERYVISSQIQTLSKKQLFYGDDLSLKREVMLYTINNLNNDNYNEYIRKFKKASAFVHAGFQHILDTSIEDHSIFIVLEHKSGKPLLQYLKNQDWVFNRIITMISDLGVSMLDGMEEQITGFSVAADNLWLSEDDRLSFINFWEDGEPQFTGPLGLCSLIIQLSTGSTQIPDPFKALDSYLLQIDQLPASPEQKSVLIKLVRRAYHGQASLSSLVIGLQGLLHIKPQTEDLFSTTEPIPAAVPLTRAPIQPKPPATYNIEIVPPEDDDEDEDFDDTRVPFYKRKTFAVIGVILVIFVIWMIWPALHSSNKPSKVEPTPSIPATIAPTATVTPEPTPTEDNSVVEPGEEIVIPNLIGLTLEEADKVLIHLRLHYDFHKEVNKETPIGIIYKQDIPPETKAAQGDRVVFWISR